VLRCCAVDGQEHNKEIYYERTIQTLEQQLLAFQQGLNGTPVDEYDDGIRSASEPYDSRMDDDNHEQAVAEYMRKCRYDMKLGWVGATTNLQSMCLWGEYSYATSLEFECSFRPEYHNLPLLQGANARRAHRGRQNVPALLPCGAL
jgi:hypothetical protein